MKKLNLIINLIEIKYRIIYLFINIIVLFIVFFEYKVELFFLISEPFLSLQEQFIYTSISEPLFIYIKLVFIFTLVACVPFSIYLFGFFFMKSVYNVYKKLYTIFFISILFITSCFSFFFFDIFLKFLFKFLLTFQRNKQNVLLQLQLEATMQQYISFFFIIIITSFFLFLIPLLFFFFTNIKSFREILSKNFIFRKYLYFFIISFFLIIAPPDILLQLLIIPIFVVVIEVYIYLLYFFRVLFNIYLDKID